MLATTSNLTEAFMNYVNNEPRSLDPEFYNVAETSYFLGAAAALGLTAIQVATIMQKTRQLTPNDVGRIIENMLAEAGEQVHNSVERQKGGK